MFASVVPGLLQEKTLLGILCPISARAFLCVVYFGTPAAGCTENFTIIFRRKRKQRSTTNIINRRHMVYKTKRIKLMSFRMLQHALSTGNVCNGGTP